MIAVGCHILLRPIIPYSLLPQVPLELESGIFRVGKSSREKTIQCVRIMRGYLMRPPRRPTLGLKTMYPIHDEGGLCFSNAETTPRLLIKGWPLLVLSIPRLSTVPVYA